MFFWGARKTGKTTFLKETFPNSHYYNFLDSKQFLRYSKEPYLLREEILALSPQIKEHPIIIDEVQKIPEVLNEVHMLIESEGLCFILCGSSARSLKKVGVNFLGGRAWPVYFYPLVFPEIVDFDLLKVLNRGTVLSHYMSPLYKKMLNGYVSTYLTEEIRNEGVVRHLPNFARFLESLPFATAELLNFSNIGRECGVSPKTVKDYFQILEDTLIGYRISPFREAPKRQLISAASKFYLFDVGVLNHLCKEPIDALSHSRAGKYFENYMAQELIAYNSIKNRDKDITFWRTKNGTEVDFIIGKGEVAIEVKISNRVRGPNLKGLKLFAQDFPQSKLCVVSTEEHKRVVKEGDHTITIYPCEVFLQELWDGKIF